MKPAKTTSRTRAQAQTKEALLGAARKLMAERGLNATSVGDIVEEAGFTKGAFYSNFESREVMLLELIRRFQAEQSATLEALLERTPPKDIREAIEQLAEVAVRHAAKKDAPLLVAEVLLHARRNPHFQAEMQAAYQQRVGPIARWFDRLKKAQQVKTSLTSLQMARTVLALAQSYALYPIEPKEIRLMMMKVLESLFEEPQ
jgi:AcrR family transcriptional regulator